MTANTCRHLFLVDDPHCVRCYQLEDAVDVPWFDRRAGETPAAAPVSLLRAGQIPAEPHTEPGVPVPPSRPLAASDRPTHDTPGGDAA